MSLSSIINQNSFLLSAILEYYPGRVIVFDKKFKCLYENSGIKNYFENNKQVELPSQDSLNYFYPNDEKWIKRALNVFTSGKAAVFIDRDSSLPEDITESVLIPVIDDSGDVTVITLLTRRINKSQFSTMEYDKENIFAKHTNSIAYLSHEMKAPLNSIIMNMDIIHADDKIPEESRNTIGVIRKELKRLNSLIKDFLRSAKTDNADGKAINPAPVINNVVSLLSEVLNRKNISVDVNLDDCFIRGNDNKLTSVFFEMISNAVDAIHSNGKIRIYGSQNCSGNNISIFIEDTGCGINEPDKIFVPYYSTKPEGTGIGLSQVKSAMREMQSDIKLISSEHGKTLFELIFKVSE